MHQNATGPGTAPRRVRVRAPGKVNLALAVGRRTEDGYHRLATVFHAVACHEDVVATAADELSVTVSGRDADLVPTGSDNLAVQAASLLAEATGVDPGVHLHLHKQVPVAGGMAGGSADAAATLLACDLLWDTGMSRDQLTELAASLGSDVPFALHGHTAVGRGRGHLLSPAMTRGQYHWVFAVRRGGISTAEAYATFDALIGAAAPIEPEVDLDLMRALRAGDAAGVGAALSNDLQDAALELEPGLAETLAVAQDAGALGVVVSGSGPTVAVLAAGHRHALGLGAKIMSAGVADDVVLATGPAPGAQVVVEGDESGRLDPVGG